MRRFAIPALAVVLATVAGVQACGPTYGYGGYSRGYQQYQQSYAAPVYQAQAYVAVPVALAVVSPYVPTVSATLQAVPVVPVAPAAPVVPQQQQVAPPAAQPVAPPAAVPQPQPATKPTPPPPDANGTQRQSLSSFTAQAISMTEIPEFVKDIDEDDDGDGVTKLVQYGNRAVAGAPPIRTVVPPRVVVPPRAPFPGYGFGGHRAFVPRAFIPRYPLGYLGSPFVGAGIGRNFGLGGYGVQASFGYGAQAFAAPAYAQSFVQQQQVYALPQAFVQQQVYAAPLIQQQVLAAPAYAPAFAPACGVGAAYGVGGGCGVQAAFGLGGGYGVGRGLRGFSVGAGFGY